MGRETFHREGWGKLQVGSAHYTVTKPCRTGVGLTWSNLARVVDRGMCCVLLAAGGVMGTGGEETVGAVSGCVCCHCSMVTVCGVRCGIYMKQGGLWVYVSKTVCGFLGMHVYQQQQCLPAPSRPPPPRPALNPPSVCVAPWFIHSMSVGCKSIQFLVHSFNKKRWRREGAL
jgi:hypothetical protein